MKQNLSPVTGFIGVFYQNPITNVFSGSLLATNSSAAVSLRDDFTLSQLGGAMVIPESVYFLDFLICLFTQTYVGVGQQAGYDYFVWRGSMSGVDCKFEKQCSIVCSNSAQYQDWSDECKQNSTRFAK